MKKTFWMTLVILLGLGLAASPVLAQSRGHDKNKDRDDRVERRDRDHDRDRDRDRDHDRDRARRHDLDDDRDRDHDRDPFFARGDHSRPPGWSHGRKTGWGDCDVPPGQAKKQGCHSFERRSHRTVIVREPGTRPVVVRRPAGEVHVHAGVDAQAH